MDQKTIIFAVNRQDAQNMCDSLGLAFEDVTWVLNAQLLSGMDTEGAKVYYTLTFQDMPAYAEAHARFGDSPAT
ncbi:hypothetical protein PP641_gp063 [Arthrobacter phage SilentRX]|uniref:Uncharacterized protein n=1 Tax=Arthrobacter phage SilentRX TaxID=2836091 RepID=A0A8F3E7K8_9CAUD|nr:hypothetical protein PP641_gp063 [Arthrobacter phage SilentRX]QWY82803.1 hypothetical protein SEA_SILENTRX_63 [Arthrobacter phage SilentRX]